MTKNDLIREILSDSTIKEKYNISDSDLDSINGDARYQKKVVQVIKSMIDDNENHINSTTKSYNKLKNILNII